jgi:hypothetical protein
MMNKTRCTMNVFIVASQRRENKNLKSVSTSHT